MDCPRWDFHVHTEHLGCANKTMAVPAILAECERLGVAAVGFNCGSATMAGYADLADEFLSLSAGRDIFVIAQPNAGRPGLVDGRAVYNLSASDFADAAKKIYDTGVRIIGGCCGTTPAHIKAMADILSGK